MLTRPVLQSWINCGPEVTLWHIRLERFHLSHDPLRANIRLQSLGVNPKIHPLTRATFYVSKLCPHPAFCPKLNTLLCQFLGGGSHPEVYLNQISHIIQPCLKSFLESISLYLIKLHPSRADSEVIPLEEVLICNPRVIFNLLVSHADYQMEKSCCFILTSCFKCFKCLINSMKFHCTM